MKQECIPVGCTLSAAVAICWWGVVSGQGGPVGVCLGGVCVSQYALRQTLPLWTEWQIGVKTLPYCNFIVDGNYKNLAKISQKLRIKWNFELTVFELSVPDLYIWLDQVDMFTK